MTFAEEIEAYAGEPIEDVVIGNMGWHDYGNDNRHEEGLNLNGIVLSWEAARNVLNYEYDSGFGAPDCHAVYVWTKSKVIYVVQYDGSTSLSWVPRNPVEGEPDMPGG